MATVRIGHSPDADDAFMFYALTAGKVKIPGVTVEHVLEDIESLNRRARTAELEVTAVSFATYLLIADQYRMMDPGASMGKGYGPILVAREPIDPRELPERVVAIPGKHTPAALRLRLYVVDPPLLEYAMRYGRGIDKETCRKFVLMYVNDYTLALGRDGRAAIERLFGEAQKKGLITAVPVIDPI